MKYFIKREIIRYYLTLISIYRYIKNKAKFYMKQIKNLIIVALIALSGVAFGQTIVGSSHDFSTQTWNTTGEICICCHTPHNAITTVPDAPLWNHQLSVATYQLYASPTFQGNATITQPSGASKLCLSCHDGTVALENFGTMTSGTNFIGGVNNLGSELTNDHPISFIYDAALSTQDAGLWNPATHQSGIGSGTITQTMLFNDKMECASCHDVHNSVGVDHLLRKSNAASALCLTCHNK
jgi:predicted CXXCH cytochrome family protein